MPKNVIITDRADLESVAVPTGVVSHKYIMDNLAVELTAAGYAVKSEVFHKNLNGEVATGIYVLEYPNADSQLDLVISWTNTYDRTMKFKCAVGAYIKASESYMLAEDKCSVKINPLDKPDAKALATIKAQVANIPTQYGICVTDANEMHTHDLSKEETASLAGRIYFDDGITSSQLIRVKDALKKSTAHLWDIYSNISGNLEGCHPKAWMNQHLALHTHTMKQIDDMKRLVITPVGEELAEVDPNQMSLLDQISEEENVNNFSDAPKLDIDKPLTLEDYADKVEPEIKSTTDVIETITEAEPEAILDATKEEDTDFNVGNLNSSDADVDSKLEQNQEALSLDAHNTKSEELEVAEKPKEETEEEIKEEVNQQEAEEKSKFPPPPKDLPVDNDALQFDPQLVNEVLETGSTEKHVEELKEEVIPLEEQVAQEYVEPVSKEEIAISKPPIVDEPKEEEDKEDPDLDFLKEGPTQDPVFSPQEDSSSSADDPFEF